MPTPVLAHRLQPSRPSRGFTLVEVATVCVIVAIIAAIALPSFNSYLMRGKRHDAITALTRLQQAQSSYQYQNGRYAADLVALGLPAHSLEGLYSLQIGSSGVDGYSATATATPDSGQAKDGDCSALRLTVSPSGTDYGPSASCWNR
ncbi:MAG: type IV pilin protein [Burkholderiaceae bacterium]|nr:type IV pilin protein [Burkholderiaceae bacterium]